MKILGQMIVLLAFAFFVLPALTAQEKKDADAKAEKKDDAKKDEAKKDEKKDPEKKDEKKTETVKKKVEDDKVVYGTKMTTRIASMKESAHDFSIEIKQFNPQKLTTQQLIQLQRDPAQRQNIMNAAMETKIVELRAADNVKVRSVNPPFQYDDKGNIKRFTQKDLIALRGKSKLPGYPSDVDNLKVGQYVELYFAKSPQQLKGAAKKAPPAKGKKAADDDDDLMPASQWQEVVMIIILQDPPPRP